MWVHPRDKQVTIWKKVAGAGSDEASAARKLVSSPRTRKQLCALNTTINLFNALASNPITVQRASP